MRFFVALWLAWLGLATPSPAETVSLAASMRAVERHEAAPALHATAPLLAASVHGVRRTPHVPAPRSPQRPPSIAAALRWHRAPRPAPAPAATDARANRRVIAARGALVEHFATAPPLAG